MAASGWQTAGEDSGDIATPRVGYAPGVFDLFHIGHLNLLREASSHCDLLVAGVVTDELAHARKGVPPTVPLRERLQIVSAIRYVDVAEVEDLPTKSAMWERVGFDTIIKGDDWADTDRGRQLEAELAPLGVEVVYLPYTPMTSSTQLRAALGITTRGVA